MDKSLCKLDRQLTNLQRSLNKHIKADGIALDDNIHKDLLIIMNKNTSSELTVQEKLRSIF